MKRSYCVGRYQHGGSSFRLKTARFKLLTMENTQLLSLANAYKEQIYTKLHELMPNRLARLDRSVFEGKTAEEVLALVYMQGVAEALDAFDLAELLRADQAPNRIDA